MVYKTVCSMQYFSFLITQLIYKKSISVPDNEKNLISPVKRKWCTAHGN